MTTPRAPRPEPGAPRQRPSDERARIAASGRTTRTIAVIAIVIAVVGVGIAAWRAIAPADAGCQTAAWDTGPKVDQLPDGWTVGASQYGVSQKNMTLLGPAPSDDTTNQAVVYATITCYPQGAADSISRSAAAAAAAKQTVTSNLGLGDQGFSAVDSTGVSFVQFRHGNVVVYLAASGDATSDEVESIASAYDLAMGGKGTTAAIGTPDVAASDDGSSPGDSAEPSAADSPAAADLEAALPSKVGATQLTIDSSLGSDILANDRVVTAALRAAGKAQDDLRIAEAYDASADTSTALDLWIRAIDVNGMKAADLKTFVLNSLLTADSPGVKTDTVDLGGKTYTRVDVGDGGPLDYVIEKNGKILIIETADPALAAQAAAALP